MSKSRWIESIRRESDRPHPAMPWARGQRRKPGAAGRRAGASQSSGAAGRRAGASQSSVPQSRPERR